MKAAYHTVACEPAAGRRHGAVVARSSVAKLIALDRPCVAEREGSSHRRPRANGKPCSAIATVRAETRPSSLLGNSSGPKTSSFSNATRKINDAMVEESTDLEDAFVELTGGNGNAEPNRKRDEPHEGETR